MDSERTTFKMENQNNMQYNTKNNYFQPNQKATLH